MAADRVGNEPNLLWHEIRTLKKRLVDRLYSVNSHHFTSLTFTSILKQQQQARAKPNKRERERARMSSKRQPHMINVDEEEDEDDLLNFASSQMFVASTTTPTTNNHNKSVLSYNNSPISTTSPFLPNKQTTTLSSIAANSNNNNINNNNHTHNTIATQQPNNQQHQMNIINNQFDDKLIDHDSTKIGGSGGSQPQPQPQQPPVITDMMPPHNTDAPSSPSTSSDRYTDLDNDVIMHNSNDNTNNNSNNSNNSSPPNSQTKKTTLSNNNNNNNNNNDDAADKSTTTTSKRMLPLWMNFNSRNSSPHGVIIDDTNIIGGMMDTAGRKTSSSGAPSVDDEKQLLLDAEAKRRKKEQSVADNVSSSSSSGTTTTDNNMNSPPPTPTWLTEMRGFTEIEEPVASGRVICFDLETTGFGSEDSIIEVGAVELIDGCRTGLTFQSYAKPKAPIHPEAAKVHNLNAYLLSSAPPIEFVLASFMDFVGDALLVAHNLAFDHRMLIQEMMRSKIPINRSKKCFCTMKYYRKVIKDVSYNLDAISSQLKIDKLLLRRTHGALVDSEILAIVYSHLTRIPPNYASLKLIDKMNQAPWNQPQPQPLNLPSSQLDLNNIYNHDQLAKNQNNNNINNNQQPILTTSSTTTTSTIPTTTTTNINNNNSILERLDHYVLTTKDLDKCLQFYCDIIGLEKEIFGQQSDRIALRINDLQKINIHVAGREFKPHASHPTPGSLDLCFISRIPIIKVIQTMFKHNIPIEEGPIPRTGACGPILSIYIRDPDDNLIEISEKIKQ
ncbi:DNA polymerase III [Cavenderia fasciculata]|uniref:DNA polymerase III n=1 Tax=Cavenderia fasciculata TaxID=261658 RepID=F4Q3Z5_CACFS|nr:DNA polymerase III [Cavenderia fasciculata]EGG16909.1 DNA polymerase III [Cavenderia fasciculata]|eukprot:XP_004355383.1 DNA polymerase III [Cavenderia fasciculata]